MQIHTNESGISDTLIAETTEGLRPYLQKLHTVVTTGTYEENESSLCAIDDSNILGHMKQLASELCTSSIRYIFVLGIGGSSLGARAVYEALRNTAPHTEQKPQLIFVESPDPIYLSTLSTLINNLSTPQELLLLVISKSGGTLETLASTENILAEAMQKFGDTVLERVVTITEEHSSLAQISTAKGIRVLPWPPKVGGRFSIFTPSGLFPLICAGVNVDELLSGARDARTAALADHLNANQVARSASVRYLASKKGETTQTFFYFAAQLESLGQWHRQLLAESLGKTVGEGSGERREGILPEISVGPRDLHSVAQLYFGGPQGTRLTTFISIDKQPATASTTLPTKTFFGDSTKNVAGKTAEAIVAIELEGVKSAYRNKKMPFLEVVLKHLDAHAVGAYMMSAMIETMLLGDLLKINTFDQPAVEFYKTEVYRLLDTNH